MAGSPIRRLRRIGAVDQDGKVIVIPRLPSVTGADKPPGWNRWSAAEKVEHLLGMALDRVHDYLGWPPHELDPHRLAAQAQAMRVVMVVAAKVGAEAHRERNRQRAVEELERALSAADEKAGDATPR
jgi:hypothetical protein